MGIKLDVNKTGFPVKIGNIELWFDCSLENLEKYLRIDELIMEKLKATSVKAKTIKLPNPNDIKDANDVDPKEFEKAFNLKRELVAAQYDIIFGDGTFDKVYKEYPDLMELERILEPLGKAIETEIENHIKTEDLVELSNIEVLH